MPKLESGRAQSEMDLYRFDALLAATPSNVYHSSGFRPRMPSLFPAVALIPRDSIDDPLLIVSDRDEAAARKASHIKDIRSYKSGMSIGALEDLLRPEVGDPQAAHNHRDDELFDLLPEALRERGLQNARIGVELHSHSNAISHAFLSRLLNRCPEAEFKDAACVFDALQSVKSEEEIEILRTCAAVAAAAFRKLLEGPLLGVSSWDLRLRYQQAVVEAISAQRLYLEHWRLSLHLGDSNKTAALPNYNISSGDIVMLDGGVTLNGYASDIGRIVAAGRASDLQRRVYDALRAGFEAELGMLKPGNRFCDVFTAGQEAIRRSGVPWFSRGHLGHSIGLEFRDFGDERAPFIAGTEERRLEPRMVLCVETPFTVEGLGSFNIEDMVVVTSEGYESLMDLPRELLEL